MALNISNYLTPRSSSWDSLRDYIITKNESFKKWKIAQEERDIANLTEDKLVLKFIQAEGKSILSPDGNAYRTFDKKIRNYKNNTEDSNGNFERQTLYPLLFVLKINNMNELLLFCRDVLHQQELSAHSLEDFLVMCSLKLGIPYNQYLDLRNKYKEQIDNQPKVSPKINAHMTGDHLDSIASFKNTNDLANYINNHIHDFARKRNTPYNMLFPCVSWLAWQKTEWTHFFNIFKEDAPEGYEDYTEQDWLNYANDDFGISAELMPKLVFFTCGVNLIYDPSRDLEDIKQEIIEKYRDYDRKKFKTNYDLIEKYRKSIIYDEKYGFSMRNYYLNIFSIVKDGLTEEQINTLSNSKNGLYKSAFISFDAYRKLYLRKCANVKATTEPITQGIYLLSLIHFYPLIDYKFGEEDDLSDYLPEEEIYELFATDDTIEDQFNYINRILSLGGFPSLNKNDPFNRLFMDTYREVLEENKSSNLSPKDVKAVFLSRFCSYLKQIADALHNKE